MLKLRKHEKLVAVLPSQGNTLLLYDQKSGDIFHETPLVGFAVIMSDGQLLTCPLSPDLHDPRDNDFAILLPDGRVFDQREEMFDSRASFTKSLLERNLRLRAEAS